MIESDQLDADGYFYHARYEILPIIRTPPRRVLEVGAASGATLRLLRRIYPSAELFAFEVEESLRDALAESCAQVHIGSLEDDWPVDLGRFDLILALDVLEHLRNPWLVLKRLTTFLHPGGSVIVSVPNIANLEVLKDLVIRRRFRYRDEGILDRTHLRFFTEESALSLVKSAGLVVEEGVITGFESRRFRALDRVSFGLLRHYCVRQYIIRARLPIRGETPDAAEHIQWRLASSRNERLPRILGPLMR